MSTPKEEPHFDEDDVVDDVPEREDAEDEGDAKKDKKKRPANALRKAPQAPKRFKSSYICFFMAKQAEIKEELGEQATVTLISKRSAEIWKNLAPQDRAFWDDAAAKDKQRYMHEKASYTGPWQVPWKRARKDPSAPRRPMSAFLYFSQGKRAQLKDANPDMKNTEISRILGEMWRNLPADERQPHIEHEKVEREKYKAAISNWRKEMDEKKEARSVHVHQVAGTALAAQSPMYPTEVFPVPSMPNAYNIYQGYPYVSPYSFPTNGKHPVILAPNGMPYYMQSSQQPQGYDDGTASLTPHNITFEYASEPAGEHNMSEVL